MDEAYNLSKLLDTFYVLDANATPGPWFMHNTNDALCMNAFAVTTKEREPDLDSTPFSVDPSVVALTLLQQPRVVSHKSGRWDYDAQAIAASRNLFRALLDVAKAVDEVSRVEPFMVDHPYGDRPNWDHRMREWEKKITPAIARLTIAMQQEVYRG